MSDPTINHTDALQQADYTKANSNLARCYLDLYKRNAGLLDALQQATTALEYGSPLKNSELTEQERVIELCKAAIDKVKEGAA
jgi:hypothetical protein